MLCSRMEFCLQHARERTGKSFECANSHATFYIYYTRSYRIPSVEESVDFNIGIRESRNILDIKERDPERAQVHTRN